MTVAELIHLLSLYPPDCIVQIDSDGPRGRNVATQVVQEALNCVVIHNQFNALAVTYKADGITPREAP